MEPPYLDLSGDVSVTGKVDAAPRGEKNYSPELTRLAHRELAEQSRRGVFIYAFLCLIIAAFTRLGQDYLLESALLTLAFLALGYARFELIRGFDRIYFEDPSRWIGRFTILTLTPAILWAGLMVFTLLRYGSGSDFTMILLAAVGMGPGRRAP